MLTEVRLRVAMDNLTHTMIGVAMARAGLSRRLGKGTTLVLAVASNLPDLDALWVMAGQGEAHFSRRLLTHSVPGMLLLAGASATVFHWLYRHMSWRVLFGLCLLAMMVHVFLDLVNSYGVVLLYPFSRTRFELGWLFIIDLAIWGILLAPLVLNRFARVYLKPERLWQSALIAVVLYLGICGMGRWRADRILQEALATGEVATGQVSIFPEPLGPHRFRGVVKQPGGFYSVYLIRVWSGRVELHRRWESHEDDPVARRVRATETGRLVEWFYKAPVWTVEPAQNISAAGSPGMWICSVIDLRFQSLVINRDTPFRYRFRVSDGSVEPLGWD